ncbi:metal ABC transporter permease [Haloactinomyces albus]|uniref:Zinc transport system permease protein n=1 Tax=Haloactinomyces albus TaxID=1352928 RepID=A0AAE3ZE27_9ACTN|nr:metal ABC transporter permease [Haloactinomyces albus]MDR7303216.1 zinc transport system permease protein [Haloactinomyces albus]
MMQVLQLEFMQNALIAAVLASIAFGIIGSLVVVNREVFIAGGIAHAAYGGVGLGFLLSLDPSLTAMGFGFVAALAMGITRRFTRQRSDTLIGMLWAVGMSLGVIFINSTPGYTANAKSYLFGSLLAVSGSDLIVIASVTAAIVAFAVLYYRPLMAYSFDPTFTLARGLPTFALELVLLAAIALTVVVLMQVVGLILLIAMLTIPAACGALFAHSLRSMMIATISIGIVTSVAGLAASYTFDLTSGPAIVLTASAAFAIALPTQRLIGWTKA